MPWPPPEWGIAEQSAPAFSPFPLDEPGLEPSIPEPAPEQPAETPAAAAPLSDGLDGFPPAHWFGPGIQEPATQPEAPPEGELQYGQQPVAEEPEEAPPAPWFQQRPALSLAPGPQGEPAMGAQAPGEPTDWRGPAVAEPFAAPGTELPAEGQEAAEEPDTDAEVEELMAMSPEDYAALQAEREAKRDAFVYEQKEANLRADRERAEDNEKMRAEAAARAQTERQKIDADLQQLAQTKIDPERWWSNRSTGQKVAGYMAAIVGGLLAPNQGGRNSGLELIMRAVDQDIDAQKADIANQSNVLGQRRGMVGELYQQSQDSFRAAETARLGLLQSLDEQLAVEAARFDPQGTTARRIAEARMGVKQAQAQAQAKLDEALFKRQTQQIQDEKTRAETRKTLAETRKINADAKRAAAEASGLSNPGRGAHRADSVYLPGTDIAIAEFKGKSAEKRATEANELVSSRDDFLRQISEYEATLEDYGKQGLFDQSTFGESKEFARLNTMRENLATPLAKVLAGGFNPSAQIEEKADKMVAEPAKWWQADRGAPLAKVRELKRNAEEGFRSHAGKYFDTSTVEKIVSHRRARAVSQKDAAEERANRAEQIIQDPKATDADKAAAVGDVVARIRKEADDRGDEDDWLYTAGPKLLEIRQGLKASDPVLKTVDASLRRIRRFAQQRRDKAASRYEAIRTGTGKAGAGSRLVTRPEAKGYQYDESRNEGLLGRIDDAIGDE